MSLVEVGALFAIVALPLCLLGAAVSVYLGVVRARRYRRRFESAEDVFREKVVPFLRRRARAVGADPARGASVVVGPGGALQVKAGGGAAEEAARLVDTIELREDGAEIAHSDTLQATPTPTPEEDADP